MAKASAAKAERKAPVRMGKLGDAELAAAIQSKLLGMVRPLSSRPKFKGVFDGVIKAVAELGTITDGHQPAAKEVA